MFKSVIRSSVTNGLRFNRGITTKTTISDAATGRVIKLTDPNRPEMGDYPNPEALLAQNKSPYVKYDDQQNRRNIGDPVNFDDDLYDMWSPDYFQFVSDKTALKHNAIFFGLIFGFGGLLTYFELNPEKPGMPRSYPYNGLAKSLGSGNPEHDYLYQSRPDLEAEAELGILPPQDDVIENTKLYESANAEFIKQ